MLLVLNVYTYNDWLQIFGEQISIGKREKKSEKLFHKLTIEALSQCIPTLHKVCSTNQKLCNESKKT